jgi:hypothetical protein
MHLFSASAIPSCISSRSLGGWYVVGAAEAVIVVVDLVVGCELVHPEKITIVTSRAKQRTVTLFRMIELSIFCSD